MFDRIDIDGKEESYAFFKIYIHWENYENVCEITENK